MRNRFDGGLLLQCCGCFPPGGKCGLRIDFRMRHGDQRPIALDALRTKLEGIAFGPDVVVEGVAKHTLYVANDNDFLAVAPGGLANPNQIYVFAFDDEDLAGSVYEPQQFRSK